MKKRILALALSVALCTMTCESVFAASSSTSGSSGSESTVNVSAPAEAPATRGTENTDKVAVAIRNADGTVSTVNLTQYTEQTNRSVVAAAVAAVGANPGEAVSAMMTTPASDLFKATINALGGNIRMVNAGGYKVTALAPGADGRGCSASAKAMSTSTCFLSRSFAIMCSISPPVPAAPVSTQWTRRRAKRWRRAAWQSCPPRR